MRDYIKNNHVGDDSPPASSGVSNGALSGARVFLVEDDKLLSELLAKKIIAEGGSITHAIDGSEAFELMKHSRPDVIVLDILLPGLDGFEVLKIIKGNDSIKSIPVILLSNLSQEKDIQRGISLGAESFMVKASVTLDEIVSAIGALLEKFSKKR